MSIACAGLLAAGSKQVQQLAPRQQQQQQQLFGALHNAVARLLSCSSSTLAQQCQLHTLQAAHHLQRLPCSSMSAAAGRSSASLLQSAAAAVGVRQVLPVLQQQGQQRCAHTLPCVPNSSALQAAAGITRSTSSSSSSIWHSAAATRHPAAATTAAAALGAVRSMATMRQVLRGARAGKPKRRDGTPALAGV